MIVEGDMLFVLDAVDTRIFDSDFEADFKAETFDI